MPVRKAFNPFYLLLVVVGVAFCITASAFGLMALREVRGPQTFAAAEEGAADAHPLLALMQTHGMTILLVELGLLAAFTFAAIGTDQYWTNRGSGTSSSTKESQPEHERAVEENARDKQSA
jgi:hypothetical protein